MFFYDEGRESKSATKRSKKGGGRPKRRKLTCSESSLDHLRPKLLLPLLQPSSIGLELLEPKHPVLELGHLKLIRRDENDLLHRCSSKKIFLSVGPQLLDEEVLEDVGVFFVFVERETARVLDNDLKSVDSSTKDGEGGFEQ